MALAQLEQSIQTLELYAQTYPSDRSPRVNIAVAYQYSVTLTKACRQYPRSDSPGARFVVRLRERGLLLQCAGKI